MTATIFLDTCSINALSSLNDNDFDLLRNSLEKSQSGLYASHIQGDERYTNRPTDVIQIYKRAFEIFEKHGIKIHWEAPTVGGVWDISRWDLATWMNKETEDVYHDLQREIRNCMEQRGKFKDKKIDETKIISNIARDCLIALTSIRYDYFITSDVCLYESWIKICQKNENRTILKKIPNTLYIKPDSQKILQATLKILNPGP